METTADIDTNSVQCFTQEHEQEPTSFHGSKKRLQSVFRETGVMHNLTPEPEKRIKLCFMGTGKKQSARRIA